MPRLFRLLAYSGRPSPSTLRQIARTCNTSFTAALNEYCRVLMYWIPSPTISSRSTSCPGESDHVRHDHRTAGKFRDYSDHCPVEPLHARHGGDYPAGSQPGGRSGYRRGAEAIRHRWLSVRLWCDTLDEQGPGTQDLSDALWRGHRRAPRLPNR